MREQLDRVPGSLYTGWHGIGPDQTKEMQGQPGLAGVRVEKRGPPQASSSDQNTRFQTPQPNRQLLPVPCHPLGAHWTSFCDPPAGAKLKGLRNSCPSEMLGQYEIGIGPKL